MTANNSLARAIHPVRSRNSLARVLGLAFLVPSFPTPSGDPLSGCVSLRDAVVWSVAGCRQCLWWMILGMSMLILSYEEGRGGGGKRVVRCRVGYRGYVERMLSR